MADHTAEIAELENILAAGARTVNNDGTSITYDLETVRRRLAQLRQADDSQRGRRPPALNIKLGGF